MQEDVTCSLGTQLAFSYDRYQMELCSQQRVSSLVAIAYLFFPFKKIVVWKFTKALFLSPFTCWQICSFLLLCKNIYIYAHNPLKYA